MALGTIVSHWGPLSRESSFCRLSLLSLLSSDYSNRWSRWEIEGTHVLEYHSIVDWGHPPIGGQFNGLFNGLK
ncbi:hypothetical protein VN12_21170 [Pirellula sp. SH-Sr6A]|nr:hypothetical protein VN12_21170 [Pirellula sp. SH-Sr6A]